MTLKAILGAATSGEGGAGNTDELPEGVTQLYFTEERVRDTVLTGFSVADATDIDATDSVLIAAGKTQAKFDVLDDTIRGTALTGLSVADGSVVDATDTVLESAGKLQAQVTGLGGGDASGYGYTFSTTTTDSDPGAGVIRFNHATQSSATIIYIDNTDSNAVDMTPLFNLLAEGQIIRFQQSVTRWSVWMVQGVVAASGYYKITVALQQHSGSALQNTAAIRFSTHSVARGYQGTLTGDITSISRNADGSVSSITIAGCPWVQSYDAAGAGIGGLATETFGGLTRTYGYSAAGLPTGVTGAVERGGHIVFTNAEGTALTAALVTAGSAASGTRWYCSDVGNGGISLIWATDHWRPNGGSEIIIGDNRTDVASDTNGTTTESSALRTFTIPGWLGSIYSWVRGEMTSTYVGTAGAKTPRIKHGGTNIQALAGSSTSATSTHQTSAKIFNKGSVSVQQGSILTSGYFGYSGSTGNTTAIFAGSINTGSDNTMTYTLQCASAADSATLSIAICYWGAS